MAFAIITLARLLEVLEYFPATGVFVWRVTTAKRIKVGDVAGGVSQGYIIIRIDGRLYRAHRLAWLCMTGAWPTNGLDHRDGNRANNRWDNLREATQVQNMQNLRKAHGDNLSSGLLGASWDKQNKKWRAQIKIDGKIRHIGYFPTAELAHTAYLEAKRKLHSFCSI